MGIYLTDKVSVFLTFNGYPDVSPPKQVRPIHLFNLQIVNGENPENRAKPHVIVLMTNK